MQDSLDTHAESVGSLEESEGRTQLDDAVTALAGHTDSHGGANLAMVGRPEQSIRLVEAWPPS